MSTLAQPRSDRFWVVAIVVAVLVGILGGLVYGINQQRASLARISQLEAKLRTAQHQLRTREVSATEEVAAPAEVQAAEEAATGQEPESIIITPQGLLLEDGSFLWQDLGTVGHFLLADGELWLPGESPNDGITDYILFHGGSVTLRMWQGTLYQYREGIDREEALAIVTERNIPDKFATTPVTTARVWEVVDKELRLLQTINRPGAAPTTAPTLAWPSRPSGAAELIGFVGERSALAAEWEGCPGEVTCWHLKDGPLTRVNVPAGVVYEGWDGSKTIRGEGPVTLTVAGLTVRPK